MNFEDQNNMSIINRKERTIEAAQKYIKQGWKVIPIPSGSKRPVIQNWQNLELMENQLPQYFSDNHNIGIRLGTPSGELVDVDLDCLEAVKLADHFLPHTSMVHGRPGNPHSHRWYICLNAKYQKWNDPANENSAPTDEKIRSVIIELRTTGQQTVVPPSRYSDEEQLVWEGELNPTKVDYSILKTAINRVAAGVMIARRWTVGIRHDLALALAGGFAQGGLERDDALKFIKAVSDITRDEEFEDRQKAVEDTYANFTNGNPINGYGELIDKLGRSVVDRLYEWLGLKKKPTIKPHLESGTQKVHLTDLGNAERLICNFGDKIRFVQEWGWLIWDGRRWVIDGDGAIYRMAIETVKGIYREAENCSNLRDQEDLIRHAQRSENRSRLEAMVKIAESLITVAAKTERFDQSPWLLNMENGTLNLRTGELKQHDPNDFITKLAPVKYDPHSDCPLFKNFLNRIFGGDADLIEFVHKSFGYSLTGSTQEQVIFVLYGSGSNGKSTLLSTMLSLLGDDYAQQGKPETFLHKNYEGIPNDIARMRGARLISMIEVGESARLNEPLIKSVTGGELLVARFLRKEYFQFQPEFKLFLAVNHKPTIKGSDYGIWRRIRLIPFSVTIPDNECDRDLPTKLKSEREGIFNWMVQGCLKYFKEGLKPPKSIADATKEYQSEMDVIGQFLDDCCEPSNKQEYASLLYQTYADWCQANGEFVVSQKKFGMSLKEKGYVNDKDRRGAYWKGLSLKHKESQPDEKCNLEDNI